MLLPLLVALLALAAPAHAGNAKPATVPALQRWEGGQGSFAVRSRTRVIAPKRLRADARLLARDLTLQTARRKPRRGDVVLKLGARGRRLGEEGYRLRIGRRVTIRARRRAGVFYGTRTLLNLLRGGGRAPRGRAADWPRYRERGLMLDTGRLFFPRKWLEQRIREMADLKLNLLHLHFSDNEGYRLESKTHPEIVDDPHLTHADIRSLQRLARRRHVTIVPELDMPGHLTAALEPHPELQLENRFGQKQADKLDVTLPEAREFVADLLGEYLPLFEGPWWHSGADEYLGIVSTENDYELYPQLEAYADEKYGEGANGKDAVTDFTNFVGEKVRAAGKRMRVWSDGMPGGALVELEPTAAVEWWENRTSHPPGELMADGRELTNAGWWPLYYVTGGPLQGLRASEEEMYEEWDPWHFEGPWTTRWLTGDPEPEPFLVPEDAENQLGAQLNVWNDVPHAMTVEEIAEGIAPRLRILAQKTWGSPQLTDDYEEFKTLGGAE